MWTVGEPVFAFVVIFSQSTSEHSIKTYFYLYTTLNCQIVYYVVPFPPGLPLSAFD